MPFQGGRRRTVMVVMVMMTMVMMMVFSGNLDDVSVQLQYSCGRSWQTCGLLDEDIHCGNSAWSQDLGTIDVGCRTSAVQIRLTLYIYIYNNWLVVWNMFCFPYIGNNNPNWLMFFRGVETTNQIYIYMYIYIYLITKALYQKHATSLRNRLRLLRRGSQPAIYWWIEDIYQLYRYIDYLILPVKIAI